MPNHAQSIPEGRTAWSYILRYRGHLVIGAVLLITTTGLSLAIPRLLGKIVNALKSADPAEAVPSLAAMMIAFAVTQALTRIGSRIAVFNAARRAEYDLRSELFRHLLVLDGSFFRKTPTGDVMSRLVNDVMTMRGMWGPGILNLVNTTIVFIAALTLMVGIDGRLTLIALLPFPTILIFGNYFSRRLYARNRKVQEQLGDLSSALQEDLTGIDLIKSFALESKRQKGFVELSETLKVHNMDVVNIRGQLIPILTGLTSLSAIIVLYVGGQAVIDPNNPMDLGTLIEFNGYLALLAWPTLALGWMVSLLQRGKASWHRLADFLSQTPAIRDGSTKAPEEIRGAIRVHNLDFSIDDQPILHDIDFEIEAGKTVAIVGRTASGKSTLVEMLPRVANAPPGTVFIDGIDITELELDALRSMIGYAPQEAFLFSRSIRDNLKLAGDNSDIESAVTTAGLRRDLEVLRDGLDTIVGERGITLSGGQRQRVALARAIATDPAILILDDSLSSVDANTEREILGNLRTVLEGRTAILVSHRVAAVRDADEILVMDEGTIVERGRHDDLLARAGVYAELYRDQLADDLIEEEANV